MANIDGTEHHASHMIAAKRVQGTTVYNTRLEKLGAIEDAMIDRASGRIAYAVLSFGGFLGVGDHYFPLPWEMLQFDKEMGGYIVDIDRDVLEGAPSYADEESALWHDEDWGRRVYAHYGVHPFWDIVP